jgi:hypothetical protein
MRKRRAIIYDSDIVIMNVLSMFFELRQYDVITCREPVPCPVYIERGACTNENPCADMIVTGLRLPRMSGIALLEAQLRNGCKLTIRNKAVLSAAFDARDLAAIKRLGCHCFLKPVELVDLEFWLAECEQRVDLSRSLGFRRRESRMDCFQEALFWGPRAGDVYGGKIVNRSNHGLCVTFDRSPSIYEIITLQEDIPILSSRVMVRWVKETDDGLYIVGMSCC